MNRIAIFTALVSSPGLVACGNPCSGPEQISNIPYSGFSTVRLFGTQSDSPEEIGAFPSLETPANGSHTWEFQWGTGDNGPIVVLIDGQAFDATGAWDLVDCGTFTVTVPEQTYIDAEGNDHTFVTSGLFMAFAHRLEGSLYWAEAWETADGTDQGDFVVQDLQVRGVIQ